MISRLLLKLVKERAGDQYECCDLHQAYSLMSFHVEHIIPRQHGLFQVAQPMDW